jgi:zinc/manganese transport system substrate-binding protein
MVLTRISALLALLAAAAVLGACGGDDASSDAPDKPTVVATTGFVADIVDGVAGGDVEVVQLVPDSSNPHSYGASAKDRRRLADADLVVEVGAGYEEGLPLDTVRAQRFALTDHVGELREGAEHDEEEGEHAGEEEEHARDPHVWMDPRRVERALPGLAAALAKAAPPKAAAFRHRAEEQAIVLRELDRDLRRTLARVPRERRKLVTSHDSLGYFAERYDLEFVAAPFGRSPEAEASARTVADVIAAVRRERVPAVFAQAGDDPKVMRRIADEAGVEIVDDLLVESPGPQARTYADALRFDARRIAGALGR